MHLIITKDAVQLSLGADVITHKYSQVDYEALVREFEQAITSKQS